VQLAKAPDDDAAFAMSIDAAVSTSDVIECDGAVDDRTKLAPIEQIREVGGVGRELCADVLYQHIGARPTETPQLVESE